MASNFTRILDSGDRILWFTLKIATVTLFNKNGNFILKTVTLFIFTHYLLTYYVQIIWDKLISKNDKSCSNRFNKVEIIRNW